jgi:hypothetical protein
VASADQPDAILPTLLPTDDATSAKDRRGIPLNDLVEELLESRLDWAHIAARLVQRAR